MDASRLFPTFHRLLRGLRMLPGRPHPAGVRVRQAHAGVLAPPMPMIAPVARMPPATAPGRPINVAPGALAPRENRPSPAHNSAAARSLRTLEEVRADLARLREQAKKRHTVEVQIRRDNSFAPTDFMDFGDPAPVARPAGIEPFPSTDFLDFTVLKSPRA